MTLELLFLASGLKGVMGTSRRNFKVKSKQVIYDPAPKVLPIGEKKAQHQLQINFKMEENMG